VVCTEDRTIPAWLQRTMAVHADRVIDLPASYSPFLSMPDRLAVVLAEVDSASGTGRAGRSGDADSKYAPAPLPPPTTCAQQVVSWTTRPRVDLAEGG
jgi:hypothetical protein